MKAPAMLVVLAAISTLVAAAQQPGPTPPNEVPQGARMIRQVEGDGVQIYTCTETSGVFKWTLKEPKAKLRYHGKVIGTHFVGPTWKLKDGGLVQGQNPRTLPDHPANAEAIAWLVIQAKPDTATGSLSSVAYITRTDTHDGVAPTKGCQSRKVGKTTKVHYSATYTFYAKK